jgi:hypothetical protein
MHERVASEDVASSSDPMGGGQALPAWGVGGLHAESPKG